MKPFRLTLANNATLTGIHHAAPPPGPGPGPGGPSPAPPTHRPLLVGLHGGSYSSSYFDADARHTAATASAALGVPFVAVDRPCYEGSTSLYPLPADTSFPEELGRWLHRFILPAVWAEFGAAAGCACVVLDCHSLAATGAIIAAALHAAEADTDAGAEGRGYPLGGMIISGFGSMLGDHVGQLDSPEPPPEVVVFPAATKDGMMLPPGTADPAIYEQSERLNKPMPFEERAALFTVWLPARWRSWAAAVRCAVMIGVAERDALWTGTEEHVRDFAAGFSSSVRVDGSLIRGAPHCIELSYWSQGWYARCFGFALECAASHAATLMGGAEDGH